MPTAQGTFAGTVAKTVDNGAAWSTPTNMIDGTFLNSSTATAAAGTTDREGLGNYGLGMNRVASGWKTVSSVSISVVIYSQLGA